MEISKEEQFSLVLLPGMDGTGLMFKPLIKLLPESFNHKVIPIPETCFFSHRELAKTVVDDLPEGPSVILAESFSGKTAYELCLMVPEKIIHVVFAASFLNKPNKLTAFSRYLPLTPLKNGLIPDWLLAKVLFGVEHPPIELLHKSLSQVDNRLLRNRLGILAKMETPEKRIDIPCTIINAVNDNLVSPEASLSISHNFKNSNTHELETGHFVLQAAPRDVEAILTTVIKECVTQ